MSVIRNPLFGVLVLLGSTTAVAEESAQSIMFEADKDKEYEQLTTLPRSSTSAGDRCSELLQQMEDLKGRPQRRYAVSQQYEAECQRR